MYSTALLSLLLAAGASAQSTTTATILVPDWCVTETNPTVTVLAQNDLTTYSYSCSIDSAAVASASQHASEVEASAKSKASALQASIGRPKQSDKPDQRLARGAGHLEVIKRDNYECYGYDAFEACIPWEVTQGASYWAAHYTVTGIVTVNQECSFGDGGIASGDAVCTGDGRVDPEVWGNTGADGKHTETFVKTDVDEFFIRNTVSVTAGGEAVATGSGAAGTATTRDFAVASGSPSAGASGTAAGVEKSESTGLAVPIALPTGSVAWMGAAGGILAAAIML